MKTFFTNLGCKLNQAELERLARQFRAAGYSTVSSLSEADLHVVNSCTVTHLAARDSRKIARRGKRLNPELRTVLTGCYATASPSEAAELAGVDLVVPNCDKDRLLELVEAAFPEQQAPPARSSLPAPFVPLGFGNSRSLIKVEDGCNMRCAFCVIPATRGRQRSRPLPAVAQEIQALTSRGCREVVLTGVQISCYRWRTYGLYELVRELLQSLGEARLRLTSIAPWQFDPRLLSLISSGPLCRHLHLSLQSGCTSTLRRMRRPYTAEQFSRLVTKVRSSVPGIAVTTDVIVGFPGETSEEFESSLAFVEDINFARVHAFPFSRRPGTAAAEMAGQIGYDVKRQRMTRMLDAARQSKRRFERQHIGTVAEVLWESCRDGKWRGTSDNYITVLGKSDETLTHQLRRERLVMCTSEGVLCRPEESRSHIPQARARPVRTVTQGRL